MHLSFILALGVPPCGNNTGAASQGINKHPAVLEEARLLLPPSLAEVIHLIRSRCDSAPVFITTETRLVSELGFCGEDIVELLHEAEWWFGVRFPADENALGDLFSLRPHEYFLTPQQGLPLSPTWLRCRLRGMPWPTQADIRVGDFSRALTVLCPKGSEI